MQTGGSHNDERSATDDWQYGRQIQHCLISYIDEEGYPVTKAMLKPRERRGIKEFWFTTNTSSNKVKCFRKNPKASIYFVDKRYFRGASLAGTGRSAGNSGGKGKNLARWGYHVLPGRRDGSRLLRAQVHSSEGQIL